MSEILHPLAVFPCIRTATWDDYGAGIFKKFLGRKLVFSNVKRVPMLKFSFEYTFVNRMNRNEWSSWDVFFPICFFVHEENVRIRSGAFLCWKSLYLFDNSIKTTFFVDIHIDEAFLVERLCEFKGIDHSNFP